MKLKNCLLLAGFVVAILAKSMAAAEINQKGLVLHLDAATQIKAGGAGTTNTVWQNLANPDAGAVLHHFKADDTSGWVGAGTPGNPYALRFDGKTGYVTGPVSLELPALTLEVWARVNGLSSVGAQRGATLIGDDFGAGGLSLMVSPAASALVLLHGVTFSPTPAEVPMTQWGQVTVTLDHDQAYFYVNGHRAGAMLAPRPWQTQHLPGFQLGTARRPDMDFVAADGLLGDIAIVRVYDRVLSAAEVTANFEADRARFLLSAYTPPTPVSSMPVPQVAGLPPAPPVRCLKWDYYYSPVQASASPAGGAGWDLVSYAFDGYPTSLGQPYPPGAWRCPPPQPDKPVEVTINYRRPVAVSRFVHYFDESRDQAGAWREVELAVSDDHINWKLLQTFRDLSPDAPQVLGIDEPVSAQHYKFSIKRLAGDAKRIAVNELETYYGAAVGNVAATANPVVQAESAALQVRVTSPDGPLANATIILAAASGLLRDQPVVPVPAIAAGGSAMVTFPVTPSNAGLIPTTLELRIGDAVIDKRPYTLHVAPKLALQNLSAAQARIAKAGDIVTLAGSVRNNGADVAKSVQVTWLGQSAKLGDLAPGQSAPFTLRTEAAPGYHDGKVTAIAGAGVVAELSRPVLVPAAGQSVAMNTATVKTDWQPAGTSVKITAQVAGVAAPVTSTLQLAATNPTPLLLVDAEPEQNLFAAAVPGGVFLLHLQPRADTGDISLQCRVVPNEPQTLNPGWLELELALAVGQPKVMFRPHIDWYRVEDGPHFPSLLNGHNSTTRMLCVQTPQATVSTVPDTDNLMWGFSKENHCLLKFQVPLLPAERRQPDRWKPISEAPANFDLTLPIRKGDWWDAFEHVVTKLFNFEQPRQWAMPVTTMQMLATRELMSYRAWSEKHQIVKCLTDENWVWTFYATAYTVPALYNWFLATDNTTAKIKAEKMIDWLLQVQHRKEPMAGGWFSSYFADPKTGAWTGGDFIRNPWFISHAVGAAVKTLLWYSDASGRKDGRLLAAAQQGCDWLLKTMRPNGGWPYAFDLDGKAITEACGAGQIWNTWALWRMYQATGDEKYKQPAQLSKDYFTKTFLNNHRYVGYWEDTVGISKENNKVIQSWEIYEAAIAAQVLGEMGDWNLAVASAKDLATWSWTRVTSTRTYETSVGETTEQSLCGPSQAQSPMVGVAFEKIYAQTGAKLWNDFSGAVKTVHFSADPDQDYGMVATTGWCMPLVAVGGPPYENVRPFMTPDMSKGDYGRQLWTGWCTDQYAWLALVWLMYEGNLRAPQYIDINPETLRGTVLGAPGRVKMPEDKCDLTPVDHYDINWVGYQNDLQYALLIMNHKEKTRVLVRPHEAHLDVFTRPPRILVGAGQNYREVKPMKQGIQYDLELPAGENAVLIWDRIK